MSDLTALSDAELLNQLKASQKAMSHTGTGGFDPNNSAWSRMYGPTVGMSGIDRFGAGVASGALNVAKHAGNLVGYPSDADLQTWEAAQAPLAADTAGKIGQFTGESAAMLPAAMGGEAALGGVLAKPLVRGLVSGAGQGYVMGDPGEKGTAAAFGAVGGAVPPALAGAAGKLAAGLKRTPTAQDLIDRGVRLTPGQMNPDSWVNKVEENVRGLPMVGNAVEHARGQAWNDVQRGVIQDAAAPGTQLPKDVTDVNQLFQIARDSYKPLYDQARGYSKFQPAIVRNQQNIPLLPAMQQQASRPGVGATRATRDAANDFVKDQYQAFADQAKKGGWTSDHLIDLRSAISEEMRNANPDQDGMKYRKLLSGARDQVTAALKSQLQPADFQALQTANDAYPKLAVIREAIKAGGDKPTGFTPFQLSQAVKKATDTGEYAAGGGLLRDWSGAGSEIFTDRNPRTGMSLETLAPILGAGTALWSHPGVAIPVGAAGAGIFGTEAGRSALRGTTPPQKLAQALGKKISTAVPLSSDATRLIGAGSRVSGATLARALALSKEQQGARAPALSAPLAASGE